MVSRSSAERIIDNSGIGTSTGSFEKLFSRSTTDPRNISPEAEEDRAGSSRSELAAFHITQLRRIESWRKFRIWKLVAGSATLFIISLITWMIIEDGYTLFKLRKLNPFDSDRWALSMTSFACHLLCVSDGFCTVAWIFSCRKSSKLSPFFLMSSIFISFIQVALAVINVALSYAWAHNSFARRSLSTRCSWTIDALWLWKSPGRVCEGDDAQSSTSWQIAGFARLFITMIVCIAWVIILAFYSRSLVAASIIEWKANPKKEMKNLLGRAREKIDVLDSSNRLDLTKTKPYPSDPNADGSNCSSEDSLSPIKKHRYSQLCAPIEWLFGLDLHQKGSEEFWNKDDCVEKSCVTAEQSESNIRSSVFNDASWAPLSTLNDRTTVEWINIYGNEDRYYGAQTLQKQESVNESRPRTSRGQTTDGAIRRPLPLKLQNTPPKRAEPNFKPSLPMPGQSKIRRIDDQSLTSTPSPLPPGAAPPRRLSERSLLSLYDTSKHIDGDDPPPLPTPSKSTSKPPVLPDSLVNGGNESIPLLNDRWLSHQGQSDENRRGKIDIRSDDDEDNSVVFSTWNKEPEPGRKVIDKLILPPLVVPVRGIDRRMDRNTSQNTPFGLETVYEQSDGISDEMIDTNAKELSPVVPETFPRNGGESSEDGGYYSADDLSEDDNGGGFSSDSQSSVDLILFSPESSKNSKKGRGEQKSLGSNNALGLIEPESCREGVALGRSGQSTSKDSPTLGDERMPKKDRDLLHHQLRLLEQEQIRQQEHEQRLGVYQPVDLSSSLGNSIRMVNTRNNDSEENILKYNNPSLQGRTDADTEKQKYISESKFSTMDGEQSAWTSTESMQYSQSSARMSPSTTPGLGQNSSSSVSQQSSTDTGRGRGRRRIFVPGKRSISDRFTHQQTATRTPANSTSSGRVIYVRMADGKLVRKLSTIHSEGEEREHNDAVADIPPERPIVVY